MCRYETMEVSRKGRIGADVNGKAMNVLSVFDGMSCGQIALTEIGVKIDRYYAAEIDKHAIKLTQHNFPGTVQLGDVTKWQQWDIDWEGIDLFLGGSPCQGFSFAGKQLAFDDPRSKLFFVFVDIWNHIKKHNPNAHFLLENVRMKHDHEAVITRFMGVHPITINSALVSAQNRVRLYWTNIANEPYGLFGDMRCMIEQPQDRGILLRDVLESDVDDKYYLSEKMINGFLKHNQTHKERGNGFTWSPSKGNKKANCVVSRCYKMGVDDNYIITHSLQPQQGKGVGGKGHLKKTDQKTYCLDTGNSQAIEFLNDRIGGFSINERGVRPHRGDEKKTGISELGTIIYDNQKTDTHLTKHVQKFIQHGRIRRLTPLECQRLQTVPEWYDMTVVSDTQRYRALGNGWTVDVIIHILKHIQ